MHRVHPIFWLLRVLSLAAMGFVLSAGMAAAHDSHTTGNGPMAHSSSLASTVMADYKAAFADRSSIEATASLKQANTAKHNDEPCSDNQSDGAHATGCCTMACHAALATLPIGLLNGPDRPGLRLFGISETFCSRSSDRMERPPKLV